jgi:cytochrome c biogenesis protein CcdA
MIEGRLVMKTKLRRFIRKALFIALFSLIYLGIGFVVAMLISIKFKYNLQVVMSYEGFFVIIIGILMSMKGNPSGISISRIGNNDASLTSYLNNEITRQERELNPYHKDFLNNNIVEFSYNNITVIFGGLLILLFGSINL